MSPTEPILDTDTRAHLIDAIFARLHERYVFPDIAQAMERAIRLRQENGEYETIVDAASLCQTLTEHLQAVSHDKHLRVLYSPDPRPIREGPEPSPEEREEERLSSTLRNHGFKKVELLAGNIGYLELRGFAHPDFGGATAVAAMAMLANSSALIIDLRWNGGGHPGMVALLCSYLFDPEPVHLNSLYWREGDHTQQFWTLPYVPGTRYTGKPVYVLISSYTFSGAEEFTYNLKNLKRATIIGETTGGGANPGGHLSIDAHIAVSIPAGRAISPITGTNWEGTGVTPDIPVPADDALTLARRLALTAILEGIGDNPTGPWRGIAEEARAALAELG